MSERTITEQGKVIGGRYRLLRRIGEGAVGSIWEAEHLTLGTTVAVKFLHHVGPPEGEASQRFVREARVSAAIKHRNVVDILDFGLTDDDFRPYMVMERLEGRSLGELLRATGPMPIAEAVRMTALVLRGLSAVHDAGVVHRDLKPENVWVVQDDDGSYAKLLDFGLSRRTGRSDMTGEGMLVGTPAYMSPEQASGSRALDARADLYSVGVILYELVTGKLPFERRSTIELIDAVLHAAPTPVAVLRPDAPEALVAIVERALSKNKSDRFQSAREMRSALAAVEPGLRLSTESGLIMLSERPPPPPSGAFGDEVPTAPTRRGIAADVPSPALPRPSERSDAPRDSPADSVPAARGGDDTVLSGTEQRGVGAPTESAKVASLPPRPAEPPIERLSAPDRADPVASFALPARDVEPPQRMRTARLLLLVVALALAAAAAWLAVGGRLPG